MRKPRGRGELHSENVESAWSIWRMTLMSCISTIWYTIHNTIRYTIYTIRRNLAQFDAIGNIQTQFTQIGHNVDNFAQFDTIIVY